MSSRMAARAARAVVAAPLVAGGVGVVLVLAGGAGRWAGLLALGWLAVGVLLLTPAGERAGVRLLDDYRAPTGPDRATLDRLLAAAAARCGADAPPARIYVRPRAPGVNAYATGRCSIAVSGEFLPAVSGGMLSDRQASAIVVHELGHLATGTVRYGLAVGWLTLPWRAAARVFGGLLRGIIAHVPTARATLLLVPLVATVAVVQALRAHAWGALAVLVWLAVVVVAQPVAAAALARAGERAADAYTTEHGAGQDLAAALRALPDPAGPRLPRWRTVRASHPGTEQRLLELTGPPASALR